MKARPRAEKPRSVAPGRCIDLVREDQWEARWIGELDPVATCVSIGEPT